jgi:hypothetical protein
MPRRIFTARDLAALRASTQRILEREPDAALVAAAARPFKRRIPTPEHEERTAVRLPVDVETSTTPGGVPLNEIAKAVQDEVPGVTGISATPGGLTLKFAREPTAAQRRKLDTLLADKTRLEELKPVLGAPALRPVEPAAADDESLRVLRDPKATNAAWLTAFRSYATAHLLGPAEPEQPSPPPE